MDFTNSQIHAAVKNGKRDVDSIAEFVKSKDTKCLLWKL